MTLMRAAGQIQAQLQGKGQPGQAATQNDYIIVREWYSIVIEFSKNQITVVRPWHQRLFHDRGDR